MALTPELGVAHDFGRGVLVHEGVVEQAELELDQQQAARGFIEAFLADQAVPDQAEEQLGAFLAAELVHAGVEDLQHPLGGGELFDAPGPCRQHLVAHDVVVDQFPVAEDHAVVAELVAEQVGDDLLVVAEADFLHGFAVEFDADRHAVIGHDGAGLLRDGGPERGQVLVEAAAGVDLFAAVGEVRVLAVALRTAAREVLGGAGNAVRPQLVALEPLEVFHDVLRAELRVLPESSRLPAPARLGGQVNGGVQRRADADGGVLLAGDLGEAADQVGTADCGQADRLGPLREVGAVNETPEFSMNAWRGSVEIVTGMPCGVCAARACRVLLQRAASRAVPSAWMLKWFMNLPRITVLVGDLLMLPGCLQQGAVGAGFDDRVEHQAGLFLEAEAGHEVGGAFVRAEVRVFEGIHDPVAVEVPVSGAVVSHGGAGGGAGSLGGVAGGAGVSVVCVARAGLGV